MQSFNSEVEISGCNLTSLDERFDLTGYILAPDIRAYPISEDALLLDRELSDEISRRWSHELMFHGTVGENGMLTHVRSK